MEVTETPVSIQLLNQSGVKEEITEEEKKFPPPPSYYQEFTTPSVYEPPDLSKIT